MKKETTFKLAPGLLIGVIALIMVVVSCKKAQLVYTVSTNTNVTTFLDKNADKFSIFRQVLARSGTADFLQAYGTYTVFLPNNTAMTAYLKQIGKNSVDDISISDLTDLVKFHVLPDTVSTANFGDGKINTLTMYGQYLTTGALVTNGETKVRINKQGNILTSNIRVGNGIIHEIDGVLLPATKTLAQTIEADPKLAIFTQGLKVTGLYDSLNVIPALNPDAMHRWLTVIAQTDSAFKAAGYANFAALQARYAKPGSDPKTITDSLHIFFDYHILTTVKYLADIGSGANHTTLAPSEVIGAKLVDKQVLINDILFNGVYEPGVLLNRSRSDVSASNGALHYTAPYASSAGTTTGHIAPKVRVPVPVYWDVADFPEVRALGSVFRKTAVRKYFPKLSATTTPIDGWDWPKTEAASGEKYGMNYCTPGGKSPAGAAVPSANASFVYGDYMGIALGVATAANPGSATNAWMQMKTPVLIKGQYKVWICYERREQTGKWPTGRRTQCQVSIDGVIMAKPFDFAEPAPVGTTAELESQGWKYYTNDPLRATAAAPIPNVLIGKMIGIINIASTTTHTIRLDVIQGNSNTDILDMIHFIPVTAASQILPRFKPDGSMDYTPIP
ncbi:fasciclin domain-containing protein [Mucilaginibacter sp. HMF5004]|uniref:fasciclin domain-containing protein n=1 Tax=Mucilaginibacter rivuli TaxID=2857527 RepID=UPI001C606F06|nr:fasciclin domain-containing protein [Mucilaginibacter rivuli]MBW4888533.1 fasciclin domain-containing protein [Mucilaginibacter rivuli]